MSISDTENTEDIKKQIEAEEDDEDDDEDQDEEDDEEDIEDELEELEEEEQEAIEPGQKKTNPIVNYNNYIQDNYVFIDGKGFAIEKKLINKLEVGIKYVTQENPKLDTFWINEGKEGRGKTNSSVVEALYFKLRTGRDVHLFFRLETMSNFAKRTENKIIIWDEPALDSMSLDQLNNLNKDLFRLFATIRKKRHIFIINYTKFWKFPEHIVVDRADCMVHMQENDVGRFLYIKKKRLEKLWEEYRTKRKRSYKKQSSFGGAMPNIMEKQFHKLGFYVNNIANATYEQYQSEKDKAIQSIGQAKNKPNMLLQQELKQLKKKIALIDFRTIKSREDLSAALGLHPKTLYVWAKH